MDGSLLSLIDLAHSGVLDQAAMLHGEIISNLSSSVTNPIPEPKKSVPTSTINGSQTSSFGYNFSPVAPWTFAMAIIGAILLFWCFVPGFLNTIRTRDTSQMSLLMWIITFFGLVFLVLFYALGMGNSITHLSASKGSINIAGVASGLTSGGTYTTHDWSGEVSSQFTVVFTCEALSLLMSTYVFFYKIYNMIKSRSLGISEFEYCEGLLKKKEEKLAAKKAAREAKQRAAEAGAQA